MSRWATIDFDKLAAEIEKFDAQILALTGYAPTDQQLSRKKLDVEKAVLVARFMATRDALVTVANCVTRQDD